MRWGLGIVLAVASAAASGAASATGPLQRAAESIVGPSQGVYLRAEDGTVLAAVAAERPVHPASVSKIPTTLALLEKLGPSHRFVTTLSVGEPVRGGRAAGRLRARGGGDPFLVGEHALVMATLLRTHGVDGVSGGFSGAGTFFFDWQPDPGGQRLAAALQGRVGAAVRDRARQMGARLDAGISIGTGDGAAGESSGVTVEHRSPMLLVVLKALNSYSNNIFHPLADAVGGVGVVEARARASVPPAWRREITLDNAAGAGTTNRLSPRAAVAITDALTAHLETLRLDLTHVLPVAGMDEGTLRTRLSEPATRGVVVAKTGTYGSLGACALAGVVQTKRWGRVTFAILNRGVPVPTARRRQDEFLRAVVAQGGSVPFPYTPPPRDAVFRAETRALN